LIAGVYSTKITILKANKTTSILISIIAYVLATGVGYLALEYIQVEMHFLLKLLVADVCATVFIFFCSLSFNNSSMYDPYWSVKPMVFAAMYMLILGFENAQTIHWMAFILMQLYGIRLTSNFYRDWPGLKHEDWRYVNFRQQFPKAYWLVSLGGIHLFPTLMVYLSCLPLYAIFMGEYQDTHPFLMLAGAAVLLFSVILVFVADEQMRSFRKNPANKGKIMNLKLWKYSRHPNYLGEILTWWGLYIMALSTGTEYWYTGIGALAINVMFVFVSIPMLDKRSLQRRPGFEAYLKQSRMLLPFPVYKK
jgi:steroid 5-alpha reductase family enzyme